MESQIYRKVGKKYVKIGPSDGWHGFPSQGLWIVQGKDGSKSESWLKKLTDIPEDIATYAKLRVRHDEICTAISNFFTSKQKESEKKQEKGYTYSYAEIATKILDELYKGDVERNRFKKQLLIETIKSYRLNFKE
jgi:hypothetical protein